MKEQQANADTSLFSVSNLILKFLHADNDNYNTDNADAANYHITQTFFSSSKNWQG